MTSRLQKKIRNRIKQYDESFLLHARDNLKIRAKSGEILPFHVNKPQLYAHNLLEEQKEKTGRVRAIILKGRQQGFSTYTGGRFFHRVQFNKGIRCFILAHEMEASDNLFSMAKRFYEHMIPPLKPSSDTSNAKELYFGKLESGYKVSTAGNKATGRGQTIQLFHGSEVAFWPNDREHVAGVLQAVPDENGTEVILESTANGMGNVFYEMCMNALKGLGEYQLIFVPWFMSDEYRVKGGKPNLSDDDKLYKELHKLDDEQMAWRERKISELGKYKFMQEYPATVSEAFQTSGDDTFIDADIVLKARSRVVEKGYGPKIMGVDPAGEGKDRTVFVWRQGNKFYEYDYENRSDLMEIVGRITAHIHTVDAVAIDAVGLGEGIVSRLRELGYAHKVYAVKGSNKADEENRYINKRAEIWGRMKEWLLDASIPNDDQVHADLCSLLWKYDSNGRIKLENKQELRQRGVPSPDIADALSFTFAYMIRPNVGEIQVVKNEYNF